MGKKPIGPDKGHKFENLVCIMYTKWISGKEHPKLFCRTRGSGSSATVNRKYNRESKMDGDIMATGSEGEFFTDRFLNECKHYKPTTDFALERALEQKGLILDWWKKTVASATVAKKTPLLIYRRNNAPIYFVMRRRTFSALSEYHGKYKYPYFTYTGNLKGTELIISEFEKLLSWIDPKTIASIKIGEL